MAGLFLIGSITPACRGAERGEVMSHLLLTSPHFISLSFEQHACCRLREPAGCSRWLHTISNTTSSLLSSRGRATDGTFRRPQNTILCMRFNQKRDVFVD